jgi:hypothetical protein
MLGEFSGEIEGFGFNRAFPRITEGWVSSLTTIAIVP